MLKFGGYNTVNVVNLFFSAEKYISTTFLMVVLVCLNLNRIPIKDSSTLAAFDASTDGCVAAER